MSQIKIRITQAHLIKIKYFQATIEQDMLVMKILVDWYIVDKVNFGRLFDEVIGNMIHRLTFIRIFFADQIGPVTNVIHLVLNHKFFFQWDLVSM